MCMGIDVLNKSGFRLSMSEQEGGADQMWKWVVGPYRNGNGQLTEWGRFQGGTEETGE